MGAFIAKQPNGLYCRFSTVVDTVTHYNMTFEDYVKYVQMSKYGRDRISAEKEARETIKCFIRPFQEVIDRFIPNNQTEDEFNELLKDMNKIV
jgi:hypothetical protein